VSSAPIKVKSSAGKARPPSGQADVQSNARDAPSPSRRRAPLRPGPDRRASEKIVHGGRTAPSAEASGSTSRGKYVYCIIESTDALRFGPIGIGADPSDVYTVHYKNLGGGGLRRAARVLDSTRENVLAHERVNETVMREHTVIPMSFGTIFKTREDIVELLRSAAKRSATC
jgi:hypothetical protein